MDIPTFDLLLQDELVFTTQSLVLPLCSTDDIGCVPQDMDVTDWLNRSDADPNNDKEKHLVINKRRKFRTPILEVCELLINVIFYCFIFLIRVHEGRVDVFPC